ncbi:MAG: hypothetical protein IKR86_05630 [Candidatus Methanomethylophilaceae archaeon]|nr:hypothetical protein [Candidatus Methanomethylophilaceae archaeon]
MTAWLCMFQKHIERGSFSLSAKRVPTELASSFVSDTSASMRSVTELMRM